jgi:hypothetical protein
MGSVMIARAAVTTANKADVIASPSKATVKVVKWALRPITMNASAKERPGRMVHIITSGGPDISSENTHKER